MRRQFALTLGLSLLNREERTDYRFSAQKGTLTVHFQTSANFTKLRSNLVITLATAYFTCSILLPVSLGLQRSQATHNPLVHGSSPCGPTTYESRANARLFFACRPTAQTRPLFPCTPCPGSLLHVPGMTPGQAAAGVKRKRSLLSLSTRHSGLALIATRWLG